MTDVPGRRKAIAIFREQVQGGGASTSCSRAERPEENSLFSSGRAGSRGVCSTKNSDKPGRPRKDWTQSFSHSYRQKRSHPVPVVSLDRMITRPSQASPLLSRRSVPRRVICDEQYTWPGNPNSLPQQQQLLPNTHPTSHDTQHQPNIHKIPPANSH